MSYYRYGFNGKEKDVNGEWGENTTNYDFGFRIYNPSIGRFLSVDKLANRYVDKSPYNFAVDNPLNVVDFDGNDTLYIHRSSLNLKLSDKFTNVWNLTFSITSNGISTPVELSDGTSEIYMFSSKKNDSKGDNYLKKKEYIIKFQKMTNHPDYELPILLANYGNGLYLHQGNDAGDFDGCKGVCHMDRAGKYLNSGSLIFEVQEKTSKIIKDIHILYQEHEPNLSGARFILMTDSKAPNPELFKFDWNSGEENSSPELRDGDYDVNGSN